MLNYKQIWYGIKPIRWLNKFNLTQLGIKVFLKSSKSTNLSFMIPAFKKKFLYLSKWEIDLNRLESIFILLSASLAGAFFFGDEGVICKQAEKATTTKYSTYVKQISTLLVPKRDECRATRPKMA